jgi:outer membrane protein
MSVVVRRFGLGLAACLLSGGTVVSAQGPAPLPVPSRIAFINARQVLVGMPGYAKAESLWTREYNVAQSEGQKLQAAFDSTLTAYQQSSAMLSPSARTAREKLLQVQQDTLQARIQALQERVQGKEKELLAPMQQRLTAIIDGIRAESNFWMVIDLGNQASQNIVSFDKSLDITDRVMRRILQSN